MRLPEVVINLARDQPCKVRKTTKDQYHARDHEHEEEVTLVSADGILNIKKLLGYDEEFRISMSTKNTTTSKDGATTIEAENRE